jgi:hypothetical protein
VKPAGNVAALTGKNPPPRKSHAIRLTQRQTQKRDKFQLFEPLLFFIDPDFENFVGLPRMLNRVYRAADISAIVEPDNFAKTRTPSMSPRQLISLVRKVLH